MKHKIKLVCPKSNVRAVCVLVQNQHDNKFVYTFVGVGSWCVVSCSLQPLHKGLDNIQDS